jgi:serine/threonine protein kinase
MLQIAEGLQALHKQEFVRRELSPDFITLRADNQSVLLTDLELAKLLDGTPPTPVDWRKNPYVAPEMSGNDAIDARSDLFSWGQILYHAATGNEPPGEPKPGQFDGVDLPDFVKKTAAKCISTGRSNRPRDVRAILKTARSWEKLAWRNGDE